MTLLRATKMLNVPTQKALMFAAVMRDTEEMEHTVKVENICQHLRKSFA